MKVSVVIPAYNASETLQAALESVAAQGVADIEVIVVDDASTDDTVEMVQEISSDSGFRFQPSGFTLLKQCSNSGPAATRNRGIAEAKGEWIAFLDDDDEWMPGKLAIQLRLAEENPEIDLWCGDEAPLERPGAESKEHRAKREMEQESVCHSVNSVQPLFLDDFVTANPVATSTVMVRKSVLDEVGGFDEQFRGPEDYDLWLRIAGRKLTTDLSRRREAKTDEHESTLTGQFEQKVTKGTKGNQRGDATPTGQGSRTAQGEQKVDPSPCSMFSAPCNSRMARINAPLARYRSEAGSLSMDDRKFLPEVFRVLDKAFADGGALHKFANQKRLALANQYRSASWMAFSRGARIQAVRLLAKAYGLGGRELNGKWCRSLLRYLFGSR